MRENDHHLSDGEILMASHGELSPEEAARVEAHLDACRPCSARRMELDRAMAEFADAYQSIELPPAGRARAILEARLAGDAGAREARPGRMHSWMIPGAVVLLLTLIGTVRLATTRYGREVVLDVPDPSLTPGVAVLEPAKRLCGESLPKNKDVSSSLRHRVLDEYGLSDAPPRAYEVDYLITPALGGTDDVRNLWPHSYANTEWNARVKDALEDKLHELVCEGKVDLPTAQREIAMNWIGAYRKYFHTDRPLAVTGAQ